jgi:RHS repeat-associated protein
MKTVDSSGVVVNEYEYDVYGTLRSSSGSQHNEFQFAGQQTDPNGLQYLRARYYDMETGQFISRDPMAASAAWMESPFVYASANATNLSDPLGLCSKFKPWQCVDELVGGIKEAGSSVVDAARDGYWDVNLTYVAGIPGVPLVGAGVTGGCQLQFQDGVDLHCYGGPVLGAPGASASVTFAPGQSITTGWSCGLQGELPLVGGVGPVGQVGVAGLNEKKREEFREVGVGIVSPPRLGGSLSCYYVGGDLLP